MAAEGAHDYSSVSGGRGLAGPHTATAFRKQAAATDDNAGQPNMQTRLKTNPKRHGFTFVEIMIVVAIVGMLAALAVPNFLRYRTASRRSICIANLKKMQEAKVQWACEFRKDFADTPVEADLIGPNNYLRDKPYCPSGGADYITTIGQVDQIATCTIASIEGHTL